MNKDKMTVSSWKNKYPIGNNLSGILASIPNKFKIINSEETANKTKSAGIQILSQDTKQLDLKKAELEILKTRRMNQLSKITEMNDILQEKIEHNSKVMV
jgi:thymidylate synthase